MTPDELQGLVVAGAAGPLVDALAPLDDTARRGLAKRAFELFQAANDHERKTDLAKLMGEAGTAASLNAELAVLGCCDGTKAKRIPPQFRWLEREMPERMLAVLLARRPAWINGWINHHIDKRWVPGTWWPVVRGLIRAGVASKPAPRAYINLMVNGIRGRIWERDEKLVPLSTCLLEDKDLLETEIWQLFETEHRGFDDDRFPNRPQNFETWTQALTRLAKEGHVDRARLIDAALNGMASGLKPASIGGMINFAAALEISVDELATRQEMLCQLLANQTGTAVTFALDGLNRLEKSKRLERDRLLETIEPVLLFPKKSQANAGVALLKTVAKNDQARRPQCLLVVVRALSNVSDDVQRRATELLEVYAASSNPMLREAVRAQIDSVSPTLRDRLSALAANVGAAANGEEPASGENLKTASLSAGAETPKTGFGPAGAEGPQAGFGPAGAESSKAGSASAVGPKLASPLADLSALERRVEQLPAKAIERWGLRRAIEAVRAAKGAKAWGSAVPCEEADYQPVPPITSPDELLEAIALAIETVSGADEVERLIDAVARFSDRRPDSKVAETIFKRFMKPTSTKGLTSSMSVPPQLVKVVGLWFGVEVGEGNPYYTDPESWWTARFEPHLTALRNGRAWQPLSTPTHAGGWIDPRVWMARLNAADSIPDSDGIQSLLRLAPFGRTEARQSIGKVPGAWHRLAEYALGGECQTGITDVFRSSLWVAAGRARQPDGDLTELRMLVGVSNVPDATRESRFTLEKKEQVVNGRSPRYNSESTFLPLDPSFDADIRKKMDDIPQCLFYPRKPTQRFSLQWIGAWVIEWNAQIWPLNPRGFLYWGINRMLQRFEASSSAYEPNHPYVDVLRPHQRTFGDIEYLALAVGCMSAEQEVRRSAGEVLVRAGVEGRLDPRPFAAALHELYTKEWFSIGRLATTLGIAARDSPQTAQVVVDTLFSFLLHFPDLPKGSHEVLDVLYQQSHRLGIPAPEPFRKQLLDQKGKTKTAQLAKELLDLQESASRAGAAGLEAINRLLERAESEAA